MQEVLDKIYAEAKHNALFLKKLLEVKNGSNAMFDFCVIVNEYGFDICPGDFFDYGETYSCNQLKSTNGGGVNPYAFFDDPFEIFYAQLELLIVDKNLNS